MMYLDSKQLLKGSPFEEPFLLREVLPTKRGTVEMNINDTLLRLF